MRNNAEQFKLMAKMLRLFTWTLALISLISMLSPLWHGDYIEVFCCERRYDELTLIESTFAWLMWNTGSVLWLFALYQMDLLSRLHSKGAVLTRKTIRCLTLFGACVALEPLVQTLGSLGLELYVGGMDNQQAQSLLANYTSDWLFLAENSFIGLLIVFMARLLEHGRQLSQEVELTI